MERLLSGERIVERRLRPILAAGAVVVKPSNYVFRATLDEKTCDYCKEMDGRDALAEPNAMPPLHGALPFHGCKTLAVNGGCRCSIVSTKSGGKLARREPIGEYLQVVERPSIEGRKTCRWYVVNTSQTDVVLGMIAWYNPWRQYVFTPLAVITLSAGCLEDIARFLKTSRKRRKAGQ